MQYLPGISDAIYLGGVKLATPPGMVSPVMLRAQSAERARNAKLHIDYLQPEPGWPMILRKLTLSLSWEAPTPEDIEVINDLVSWGGPIDVCYWKPITESYWLAAGAPWAGYLTRRNALDVISPLPPNAATRFAIAGDHGGTSLTVTLGTPDADGVTPWSAPGTSTGERAAVSYVPSFSMVVDESQEEFTEINAQPQTLRLVEV